MNRIYIFGHQRPDTDSVCASIALSYLKNELGYNTEPKILGHLNKETKYALNYFKVKEPDYLNDVKVQIKNMNYNKNAIISEKSSIQDAFNLMQQEGETGVCVVDESQKLKGLSTLKELARQLIGGDKKTLKTNLHNIVKVLEGKLILAFQEEIEGTIIAATYQSKTIQEDIHLGPNNILIIGDRYKILENAICSKVQLIIITGDCELPNDLFEKARTNHINIISTNLDTYQISNQLLISNYVSTVLTDIDPTTINILDYRTDFLTISEKSPFSNYPVVNKSGKCLGLLKINKVNQYEKLHVILVDHNAFSQSVEGIDEAIIDEIIDHHNLLNIVTPTPINFRSMPLGSTCTIIYFMFKENNIEIPKHIAGIMLSAILSDTLLLRSVTTTAEDKDVANILATIADVNIAKYGHNMVKAGFSLQDQKVENLIEEDIKTFTINHKVVGISQIFTMDYEDIKDDIPDFITKINFLADVKFDILITLITDIEKNGSYVFFDHKSEKLIQEIFDDDTFQEGNYVQDLLSRKKQLVPKVMEALEK